MAYFSAVTGTVVLLSVPVDPTSSTTTAPAPAVAPSTPYLGDGGATRDATGATRNDDFGGSHNTGSNNNGGTNNPGGGQIVLPNNRGFAG